MFCEHLDRDAVAGRLLAASDWRPHPDITSRETWADLPATLRQEIAARAEAALEQVDVAPLPATLFLEYVRTGNRDRYQNVRNRRRMAIADLALGECLQDDGRYLDALADGLWATCEESFWGVPAHIRVQKLGPGLPDVDEPVVDLFAAETAAALAWILYLTADRLDAVSPVIRRRVAGELQRRMLTPCLERDDFWWMGLNRERRVNNWNPWICSNWLTTALLAEPDESRRIDAVHKSLICLDRFVDPYPTDGGCDEGPSYWGRAGASLFDCLDLLHCASGGAIDFYGEPLIREIGRFIYRVHIGGDDYINFADAPAVVTPDAALVSAYGRAIDDEGMQQFGAALAHRQQQRSGANVDLGRRLRGLFQPASSVSSEAESPLPRDVWLDQIQVMVARDSEGSTSGFFVGAKGGHNDESHNHNDIGHYVLYLDGCPVVVDAGVETYTAKTFSADRYDIWTMQSAYHNLPTVGRVQQAPGDQYAARDLSHDADASRACLSLDLAGAYPDGCVRRWTRQIELQRGVHLDVADDFDLAAPTTDLTLNLLVASEPVVEAEGVVMLQERELGDDRRTGAARLEWSIPGADLHIDHIDLEDARLSQIWANRLYRLRWVVAGPTQQGHWSLRFSRETS